MYMSGRKSTRSSIDQNSDSDRIFFLGWTNSELADLDQNLVLYQPRSGSCNYQ